MNIAIDIGHANGTGSTGNGYEEHALCTKIGAELAEALIGYGHTVVVLDYPEDTNSTDLVKTVSAINAGGFDLSISLHADASDRKKACGGHVCYHPSSKIGKAIASHIAYPLSTTMPGRSQTIVKRPELYVLRKTTCPAVLVECGFITNARDAQVMAEFPSRIANAIAQGIYTYTKKNK